MTDENMKLWKEVARPPLSALKTIKGGRLSGMSNISPQWRWQVMTENFGMVGFGWKYTIEKRWTSPGENGEQFAFVEVLLYVKVDGQWSEAIPGEGGSMLVSKEKNGFHNNDEAFKMSVTDALGTAMAKLGVGADIYLGTFDGSKYNTPVEFKNTINSPQEAKKFTTQSSEVPPTEDAKPVEEEFPRKKEIEGINEAVKEAQELSQGYTPNQILSSKNGELVKELVKLSEKPTVEVCKFIASLEKGKKYTLGNIVNAMSPQEETGE